MSAHGCNGFSYPKSVLEASSLAVKNEPRILQQAILSSALVTHEVVVNGFRLTGLHQYNSNAIKYDKYFKNVQSTSVQGIVTLRSTSSCKLSYFEQLIEKETLIEFRNSTENN